MSVRGFKAVAERIDDMMIAGRAPKDIVGSFKEELRESVKGVLREVYEVELKDLE